MKHKFKNSRFGSSRGAAVIEYSLLLLICIGVGAACIVQSGCNSGWIFARVMAEGFDGGTEGAEIP